MADEFDVTIIGGGPGGYACALKAAQLGLRVAVAEKRPALGGTCLNVGCIPSKALLDSSERFVETKQLARHGVVVGDVRLDLAALMARKSAIVSDLVKGIAGLFKKNKVEWLSGTGRLLGGGRVAVQGSDGSVGTVTAKAIVLATGSEPTALPGVAFDGTHIVSSTEAIAFDAVPKELIVVGAGFIGLELGSVWARLGSKVTVLEFLPRILPPVDGEIAGLVQKSLTRQGLTFHLDTKVTGVRVEGGRATVTAQKQGQEWKLVADKVLLATGRRPFSQGLGLAEAGVTVEERSGRVPVDANYRTNVEGVYAIGDLIVGPMLAHKAQMEGEVLAERLAGHQAFVNYEAIPSVVYIWPEVANVGPTEEQLKEAGRTYKVGKFPFLANGRARCLGDTEGIVKVLADATTDRLLAVHVFGPRASDLLAEAVTTLEFGGSAEDVARICHGHPTLSEALGEAARAAAFGKPLHL